MYDRLALCTVNDTNWKKSYLYITGGAKRERVTWESVFPTGIYILATQKNLPPPPLKFFPVFVDFLRSFKLHKGILTCVLSLLFFPLFPPFFHVFLQILPLFFNLDKNFPLGNGQNIYPCFLDGNPKRAADNHSAGRNTGRRRWQAAAHRQSRQIQSGQEEAAATTINWILVGCNEE